MKKIAVLIAVGVTAVILIGCSPSTSDGTSEKKETTAVEKEKPACGPDCTKPCCAK